MSRLCLLGFSGSVLSLIFNSLKAVNWSRPVLILENIKVEDPVTFESGVPYQRLWHSEYKAHPDDSFAFSMMTPSIKGAVFDFFLEHHQISREKYFTLLHPSVSAAETAFLENGIYAEPACVLSPFARIGFGVSINRGCTIGHHTTIGDFATINPGSHIAGHCFIGQGTSIGIGTVVFDHIKIGQKSIIGGGSVVTKDIPDGVLAFGNPCKVIKEIA